MLLFIDNLMSYLEKDTVQLLIWYLKTFLYYINGLFI